MNYRTAKSNMEIIDKILSGLKEAVVLLNLKLAADLFLNFSFGKTKDFHT